MLYRYALDPHSGAQPIPFGFDGQLDWDQIDDTEKARRGWVRDAPPAYDPIWEDLAVTFAQGDGGVWAATYTVSPAADLARPLKEALRLVAARRWDEQNKPTSVTIGGTAYRFLSTKEGRGDLNDAKQLADAFEEAHPGTPFAMSWKSLDGYVTVTKADLVAIGLAIGLRVAACFAREAAVQTTLAAAPKTETLRGALDTEISAGWPA